MPLDYQTSLIIFCTSTCCKIRLGGPLHCVHSLKTQAVVSSWWLSKHKHMTCSRCSGNPISWHGHNVPRADHPSTMGLGHVAITNPFGPHVRMLPLHRTLWKKRLRVEVSTTIQMHLLIGGTTGYGHYLQSGICRLINEQHSNELYLPCKSTHQVSTRSL